MHNDKPMRECNHAKIAGQDGWEGIGDRGDLPYIPVNLGVSLGEHDGREVFQPNADRYCHTAIVGGTGSGKSNLLHQMMRSDIRSGAGVAVIATHAEDALYPLMCVPPERLGDVVVIDATDAEYLPCLNPLGVDCDDPIARNNAMEKALELLKSGFRNDFAGPRFDSRVRLGLKTMLDLCSPEERCLGKMQQLMTDPDLVKEHLRQCTDRYVWDQWTQVFPSAQRSSDAGEVTEWVLSKFSAFMANSTLAAMFGPGEKTVDFQDVVDGGKILVVLAPATCIGEEAARIVKTWVLMELKDAIMNRGGGKGARGLIRSACSREGQLDPFFIYIDEFGEVASEQFASMLSQIRKRNAGFILSFQNLEQLRIFDPVRNCESKQLLDSVLSNTGTFIAFSADGEDSPAIARRFRTEPRNMRSIKRFKPKAMVRLDSAEAGPLTLSIPLKPEPDNPQAPALIMENLIESGVLLETETRLTL